MSGRWTEHFSLNLWSNKIKIRILDFFLIRKFSVLQFSILVLIKCTGKKTKTILWWFFCHLIADRVPVVMWRGVTGLERFSFAVEKGIKSRGEYSFDLYHQVRGSSDSIHFVFGRYPHLLSFYFYIHTHFIEPRKWCFSGKINLKKTETVTMIVNHTLEGITRLRMLRLPTKYLCTLIVL